jgi:hypothetical protein
MNLSVKNKYSTEELTSYGKLPISETKIQLFWCDDRDAENLKSRIHKFISNEDPGATYTVVMNPLYVHMAESYKSVFSDDLIVTKFEGREFLLGLVKGIRKSIKETTKNYGQHYIFFVSGILGMESIVDVLNGAILSDSPFELEGASFFENVPSFDMVLCENTNLSYMYRLYRPTFKRPITITSLLSLCDYRYMEIPCTRSITCTMHLGKSLVTTGISSARPEVEFVRYLGEEYAKEDALYNAYNYIGGVFAFVEYHSSFSGKEKIFNFYETADLTYLLNEE